MVYGKLSLVLIFAGQIHAFFRLPCNSPLVVERVDPIMSPGVVAGHVHTINGASNFSPSATHADLRNSVCSSCSVKQDMSVYWTPSLYFAHKDGSFQSVQQTGGSLIYYLFRFNALDTNKIVQAFPPGLKMLVGSPGRRNYDNSLQSQAIGWNCLGTSSTSRQPFLPTTPCPNGLRGEIRFPSCWNGKDLDSDDHISHMAYPADNESGVCPSTHPVRIVTLFYETLWSIDAFESMRSQALNPSQPFVISNGDPTGYSYHGDFMDGWADGILQQAINTCTSASGVIEECSILQLTNPATDGVCQKTPDVNEVVLGKLASLPGCNPVASAIALTPPVCPKYTVPQLFKKTVAFTGDVPPPGSQVLATSPQVVMSYKGYIHQDCYSDQDTVRALPNQLTISKKTVESCLEAAIAIGAKYVGIEYFGECWTGNTLLASSKPVGFGLCGAPCLDNPLQICGGTHRTMDLYILGSTPLSSGAFSASKAIPLKSNSAAVVFQYGGYIQMGCYSDNTAARYLPIRLSPSVQTVNACLDLAKSSGYSFVGLEYGGECWAGRSLSKASKALPSATCSMTCADNKATLCGGKNAMNYYRYAGILSTEPTTLLSYKTWTYVDCHREAINGRGLVNRLKTTSNTVQACLDSATAAGFSMAGLEYMGECWAANTLASTSITSPGGAADCQAICSGDSTKFCGGMTGQFTYYTSTSLSASSVSASSVSLQAKLVANKLASHFAHRARMLNFVA